MEGYDWIKDRTGLSIGLDRTCLDCAYSAKIHQHWMKGKDWIKDMTGWKDRTG